MPNKYIDKILEILSETYPEARCGLNFSNPFELLISTILSAQTTDKKVNLVTKELFARYPSPEKFLELSPSQLEEAIRSIGLHKSKAKNILATCKILVEKFNGRIPHTLEELTGLPGVGRKTANVVLVNAFAIPAFPVDTHVLRVANRLNLVQTNDPLKAEQKLTSIIPRELWGQAHHLFIWHGRNICKARKPQCQNCPLAPYCPKPGYGFS